MATTARLRRSDRGGPPTGGARIVRAWRITFTVGLLAGLAQGQMTIRGTATCGQTISGNTASGTNTVGHSAPENWWRFTANPTGTYRFNSCGSSYDTYVHVYRRTGTSGRGSLVSTCDDCGPCGVRTVLTVVLSAGNYWVVMDGFSTRSGWYRLQITCPSAPTVVGTIACGQTRSGNTATSGTNTVGHSAPEHWWQFTASATGSYTFNSCGSSYDTWIHVYRRSGSSVSSVASTCDDCGPCGTRTVLTSTLSAGAYWVVMDGFSSSRGTYRLVITCPATRTIRGTVSCAQTVTGTTTGAANTVGHSAPENWWRFAAPRNGLYVFNSCGSSYDTYIHIYQRTTSDAVGARVSTCDDCGPCGLRTVLSVSLSAANYWVVMDGFSSNRGNYRLLVTCPSTVVGTIACGQTRSGNTATSGTNTVGHSAPEHWWLFVAPRNGVVNFDSCGSSYDTWIHVYRRSGNSVGSAVVSCDDCGPCGLRTVISPTLSAGSYWVVMDGFSTRSGIYRLSVTCPTSSPTNLPTLSPTFAPTRSPTPPPTPAPTLQPTRRPTQQPTRIPTRQPTLHACSDGSHGCSLPSTYCAVQGAGYVCACSPGYSRPNGCPTCSATQCALTPNPTTAPTRPPTLAPTIQPTRLPTDNPTNRPSNAPTEPPTTRPSDHPSTQPTHRPSPRPTDRPTPQPSLRPTLQPSDQPTTRPTLAPTEHACVDGTHNCDTTSTSCAQSGSTFTCVCRAGFHRPTNCATCSTTACVATDAPTTSPTENPTRDPTNSPTVRPTTTPTRLPTVRPTLPPTEAPTSTPSNVPSVSPSHSPTFSPSDAPTDAPTTSPTFLPTRPPSVSPTSNPTFHPCTGGTQVCQSPSTYCTTNLTAGPTIGQGSTQFACACNESAGFVTRISPVACQTQSPTNVPTVSPTRAPTFTPTTTPTTLPTVRPTVTPSTSPTALPTLLPTFAPTHTPTNNPTTGTPTAAPTNTPTFTPSDASTGAPTTVPSSLPSEEPSPSPTTSPTASPTQSPTQQPTESPVTPIPIFTGAPTLGSGASTAESSKKSEFPWWILILVAVICVALLVGAALFRRTKRKDDFVSARGGNQAFTNPLYDSTAHEIHKADNPVFGTEESIVPDEPALEDDGYLDTVSPFTEEDADVQPTVPHGGLKEPVEGVALYDDTGFYGEQRDDGGIVGVDGFIAAHEKNADDNVLYDTAADAYATPIGNDAENGMYDTYGGSPDPASVGEDNFDGRHAGFKDSGMPDGDASGGVYETYAPGDVVDFDTVDFDEDGVVEQGPGIKPEEDAALMF